MFCGYSYIAHGRSWVPDPVGGVLWFGFAQPAETVYMPFYASTAAVPESFHTTNRSVFSRDSAWWAFNYVTNWATINYRLVGEDIKAQQQQIEQRELAAQEGIEKRALEILKSDGEAACRKYLADYSAKNSISTVASWWNFADSLVARYSNQMVTDPATGTSQNPGYPDWWLEEAGYQYGPRVYDYEGLQKVPGLAYTNRTVFTTLGNEVQYIRKTQQKSLSGTSFDPITTTLGALRELLGGEA